MTNHNYALIMAGGQGTRFWPYSTPERPKQFLSIAGETPLITRTFQRLNQFIPEEHIFVVAEESYRQRVLETVPGFLSKNYIAEPVPRNTAPCLILANIVLSRHDPDGRVLVVPADHHIMDEDTFASQMRDALEFADRKVIVTAGILPDQPHTGYGYIRYDRERAETLGGTEFFPVREFVEKPDAKTAAGYLSQGGYCWNSGMFAYKLAHFREFLDQYAPYYGGRYAALASASPAEVAGIFAEIRPLSIDYALMEKVREVYMLPAAFDWNDVGAWPSVYDLGRKDARGNVADENHVMIDADNCLVFSTDSVPVAVIGLDDVAVIRTPRGLLVGRMDRMQQVKDVVQQLKAPGKGSEKVDSHADTD